MKALELAESPGQLARSALSVNTQETARAEEDLRGARLDLARVKAKQDHLRWERTTLVQRLRSLYPGEVFSDPPLVPCDAPGHIDAWGRVQLPQKTLLDHPEGTHVYFVRAKTGHWTLCTDETMHAYLKAASGPEDKETKGTECPEGCFEPAEPTCPKGFTWNKSLRQCVPDGSGRGAISSKASGSVATPDDQEDDEQEDDQPW
jgi:hypothetical protein